MKDIIDERNERERISKSIVKSWNVNYAPAPPKQEEKKEEESADEIIERLRAEEESAKRAHIDAIIDEVRTREKSYNAATGSYSGGYGNGDVEDEVTRGQIDAILHEKSDAIREIVESGEKTREQIDAILHEKSDAIREIVEKGGT